MLRFNPGKRATAADMLNHPWLRGELPEPGAELVRMSAEKRAAAQSSPRDALGHSKQHNNNPAAGSSRQSRSRFDDTDVGGHGGGASEGGRGGGGAHVRGNMGMRSTTPRGDEGYSDASGDSRPRRGDADSRNDEAAADARSSDPCYDPRFEQQQQFHQQQSGPYTQLQQRGPYAQQHGSAAGAIDDEGYDGDSYEGGADDDGSEFMDGDSDYDDADDAAAAARAAREGVALGFEPGIDFESGMIEFEPGMEFDGAAAAAAAGAEYGEFSGELEGERGAVAGTGFAGTPAFAGGCGKRCRCGADWSRPDPVCAECEARCGARARGVLDAWAARAR